MVFVAVHELTDGYVVELSFPALDLELVVVNDLDVATWVWSETGEVVLGRA